jgi:ribosome biogenesis protein ERB1
MKTIAEQKAEKEEKEKEADKCWDIWEDDSIVTWKPRKMPKAITAPKRDLPAHGESFNPPEEYLFDEKEKEEWHANDEEDRQTNYLPQKFDALRKVPLYESLIQEHFERCLDLYLCPRLLRKKVNVTDPTKLIPELPSPNDLKPFPTQVSFDFTFHKSPVRTIAISPNGLFLASGDEQHNLIIWCTRTTKILRKYELNNKVIDCIEWCPNVDYGMLAVTNEE